MNLQELLQRPLSDIPNLLQVDKIVLEYGQTNFRQTCNAFGFFTRYPFYSVTFGDLNGYIVSVTEELLQVLTPAYPTAEIVNVKIGNDLIHKQLQYEFMDKDSYIKKIEASTLKEGPTTKPNNADFRGHDRNNHSSDHSDSFNFDARDVNYQNQFGQTALHQAAFLGKMDKVVTLLTNGADINLRDGDGKTALFWALQAKRKNVTQLLIERNADVNISDYQGLFPLHLAAWHNWYAVCELCIKKCTNVNSMNVYGETPLDYATGTLLSLFHSLSLIYHLCRERKHICYRLACPTWWLQSRIPLSIC